MEASIPAAKPRVLFIGDGLCDWLEEHQGCLVNCNALLACTSLANFDAGLLDPGAELDAVVVECSGSAAASLAALAQLTEVLGTSNIVALHRFGNERWVRELEQRGYRTGSFPPDPALLAFILTRRAAEAAASPGSGSLGELVEGRPRLFSEQELSEARKLEENVACECPRHITDLVRALAMFEDYSATCSVENWQDASLHACIYAYTGQARWLMEKALGLAVDSHREESAIA